MKVEHLDIYEAYVVGKLEPSTAYVRGSASLGRVFGIRVEGGAGAFANVVEWRESRNGEGPKVEVTKVRRDSECRIVDAVVTYTMKKEEK